MRLSEDEDLPKYSKKRRLEHRLRVVEKRDRMLEKDRSSDSAVMEEVFDRSTLMTIYDLLNRGVIKRIHGVVKAGKESRVYRGVDSEERDLAIKIYLVASAEFRRGMLPYIVGDPRFKRVKRDSRSLVYAWAQKEFKNLKRAEEAGVRVPKPVYVKNNVLVMEFIGENGLPAHLLKDQPPKRPTAMYQRILEYVKMLYRRAGLVHGDLSEYNIMNWREEPVIFDVSQAVLLEHPMADKLLRRDLKSINGYFERMDVKVKVLDDLYRWVVGDG
ncbi:MAG: serine protein kinase RIO [Candidatus Bathyarchaeia archaeon]